MTPPMSSRTVRSRKRLDEAIPPTLRPLVRAYALGYASAVAPRLLTLLLQHITRRRNRPKTTDDIAPPRDSFLESFRRIVLGGFNPRRFPTFCATLVGGTTLLELPFHHLLAKCISGLSKSALTRLSRWFAAFVSAWLSLKLLQSNHSASFTEKAPVKSDAPPGVEIKTIRYAGRTLDLTLFALTRALDVLVGELWSQRRRRRVANSTWTSFESGISSLTDSAMFAISCSFVMWAWIYHPERLPRAYQKWIGSAAAVDDRLIKALQLVRKGEIKYGAVNEHAPLLESMCAEYKWPLEWGNAAKSVPYPCEVVHMGCGPSCEYHAISRFYQSWKWSMATYLPLNLLLIVRNPNLKGLRHALVSASRSSAFLGAFITLFYYGVCLARTRVGPNIIGRDTQCRQKIDGGICVGSGCFLCGWSILIENAGRRKDMALFVAPRAMATLLPRRYSMDKQWRETLVFAASTAVVFTCVLENQRRVRGVLGTVLASVLRA